MKSILRARVCLLFLGLTAICLAFPLVWRQLHATPPVNPRAAAPAPPSSYGQVPLSFEANYGQAHEPVKYLARGTNATLYLTPTEAALEVKGMRKAERGRRSADFGMRKEENSPVPRVAPSPISNLQSALVKMKLLGANPAPTLRGQQELPGKSNYFSGNNPSQWQTNIPTYARVKYEQVYAGIDLVYYGNQQQLEYDFVVSAGADPNAIKFSFEGAEQVALNAQGELVLQTAAGEVKQHKPVIYQEVNGARQAVAGEYVMQADQQIGFAVGAYDATKPLVIDPIISWASYVGGQSSASASTLTADKSGNVYLVVWDGPTPTAGAYDSGSGYSVMKVNPSGTAVLWTARIGASSFDRAHGIALDKDNNVYLTGAAASSQYPTTLGAFQDDYGITCGGCRNAFVTKLSADGAQLLYSTFLKGDNAPLGSTKSSYGTALTVDTQGNAYVTGATWVLDFPVTPEAFQAQMKTNPRVGVPNDAFVTKVNATGTGLVYSTYLGDESNLDEGRSIVVDAQGKAFIAGVTANGSTGVGAPKVGSFPTTTGAYVTDDTAGGIVVFLTKLNAAGTGAIYSALVGSGVERRDPVKVAVDASGSAYLAGNTWSQNFPTTPGAYRRLADLRPEDYREAYVTKVHSSGSMLVYSTFLGGSGSEYATGVSVDAQGNVTVAGLTNSPDFPQTDGQQPVPHAVGFLTRLNSTGSNVLYSTLYLGGPFDGLADVGTGSYYVFGGIRNEFIPTQGVFQSTLSPHFITKLTIPSQATTVSAASYDGAPLASEAIVSAFGTGLATTTKSAFALPLPTILSGTTVNVRDSIGTEREAPLFFVSPTQVNFQIPPGTANGNATITITREDGGVSVSQMQIVNVAPSLFSADATGRGLAAAEVQRAGASTVEPAVRFDPIRGQMVAVPIDLGGANDQVYLVLYGTGLRLRSSLSNVTATIGGVNATVSYAGSQNGFVGLDQVNILIPRSLIGRRIVDIALNVDGKNANIVKVSIK